MPLYRVITDWTGPQVTGPSVSVLWFNSLGGTAQQATSAVSVFLDGILDRITSGLTYHNRSDVHTIDAVTKKTTAITAVGPGSGAGTSGGAYLPTATQGRIDLHTGVIIDGRELRGKFFAPAPTNSDSGAGNPTPAYITDLNANAATLIASPNAQWVIWSRTHGVFADVASATTWPKWSVLRSRRD